MSLPPPETLHTSSQLTQTNILNSLFEPCPTLTSYLIPKLFNNISKPYKSYNELIEKSHDLLTELRQDPTTPKSTIESIVSAHPRLGPQKPSSTTTTTTTTTITELSDHSSSEQAQLKGTPEQAEQLLKLNELYELTFPGLRFVVFVNGRSRESIMIDMKDRINRNDYKLEIKEAFDAMCDIALDRANKLGVKLEGKL
ncbi:hypothetical protein CANARDRAFT_27636 [[Candida] arabinofermentans NRRL YB-2248]|uniref:Oxo-4-hydroxy-4-carboxy-5-ureidoimidazoline decarboxylase domain-containing protein n=1 Tax=[Candida] arabinofermentans NRRL YB-2248 TaxID=983967 RepID=A0A1E4T3W2_9ASCO|nr:hypothetical protein CANARDRAFT_27636 [[Candida] arabinofermentans NRRL YB-2248]